jgi:hypothetical protein
MDDYERMRFLERYAGVSGWINSPDVWTYASAAFPYYTFTVPGDRRDILYEGIRVKLTQASVKYFLVTNATYAAPNTTVTLYGGEDYDLANALITDPYYSPDYAPSGYLLYFDEVLGPEADQYAHISSIEANDVTRNTKIANLESGWVAVADTWTFGAADAPTFTFTIPADRRTTLYPGVKIRLTHAAAVKYFIVTASSYSAPNTTVTVYGGTDYVLAAGAITSPYYSTAKAPTGFPLNFDKWSVIVSNTSDVTQASPGAGTWYNLGSISIPVPIGLWLVSYEVTLRVIRAAAGVVDEFVTLSDANNTELSKTWTGHIYASYAIDFRGTITQIPTVISRPSAKAAYYLNAKTSTASMINIYFYGASARTTTIKAVCAYL